MNLSTVKSFRWGARSGVGRRGGAFSCVICISCFNEITEMIKSDLSLPYLHQQKVTPCTTGENGLKGLGNRNVYN